MKIYLDTDELYQDRLYEHKLAVILGRGKRLKKMLDTFPTEYDFKSASLTRIARTINIENKNSKILLQLRELDKTYKKLTNPKFDIHLSRKPNAKVIMCIDTEYLWSDLDSIQYAIKDSQGWKLGIIFTNKDLAPAVEIVKGIEILKEIISEVKPDIFVGHNFNCDITVLEKAYGSKIKALHNYDDTMKMVRNSNISNIISGASLDKIIESLFDGNTIGLFNAYQDLDLFIKYGLKDAIYPIYAREYFMTGKLPKIADKIKINRIIKSEVWNLIDFDSIFLKEED
ncbi:hypothetical protein BX659_12082 [Orenia metallireducens]|uniref:Uncharacterized protein n=1 Tax=Orenia metallireducens TaxID=1413210 RepID=A0A285H085_9FIRM|nr:hypothetical protein [Orenia metallireducens]PRX26491.1 hypothetical protein BX659_12082 [Orenia metallireducens]SNY28954.1 hypothetical protein SAMN06265827_11282 [Orenia metallireducens]